MPLWTWEEEQLRESGACLNSQSQSFCVVPPSQLSTNQQQFGKERGDSGYFSSMCWGDVVI